MLYIKSQTSIFCKPSKKAEVFFHNSYKNYKSKYFLLLILFIVDYMHDHTHFFVRKPEETKKQIKAIVFVDLFINCLMPNRYLVRKKKDEN